MSRAVAGLGLFLLLTFLRLPSAEAQTLDFSAVDEAALSAVKAGDIPGAVILIGQGDRILYLKEFGARSLLPRREPMTVDTIFDVASLTKVIVTTPSILLLREQGKLELDAPLGRYLTEFSGVAYREVTLRRILTHTAGLPPMPPDEAVRAGFPKAAQALAAGKLLYPPGRRFRYSDTGFILLGEIVRRLSGVPLERFATDHLFLPLGMRDTKFRPDPSLRVRIAPTEVVSGVPLRGEVHDPRARLLGGVAGHAGVFSTARDLARFCQMMVNHGAFQGRQILKLGTIRDMMAPHETSRGLRGLGWDMSSPFARSLGPFFPSGSVGHTGFTGPALWLDPASRTYLIILTNRVHPYGKGRVKELRMRVAAALAAALFGMPARRSSAPRSELQVGKGHRSAIPRGATLSGLDVLARRGFAPLARRSVALLTNRTGVDSRGRRGIDLLAQAPEVRLAAVFTPEHGLSGEATGRVSHDRDQATGLPVWSLYGDHRRPTDAMLDGIDTLVVDLQDVGVRYYTYLTTLVYLLQAGARRGMPVVVLDRPNPITGRIVEGPVMDPDLRSFTAPHPVPVRTGLTIGEFARLVAAERKLSVSLTVVPLAGWARSLWFDETGLPWVNPSPNIRSLSQALLYAGVGLLEATNLSVGRGTETPFELIGAPWLGPIPLAGAMNSLGLDGIEFQPVHFTPSTDIYAGEQVGGIRFVVTDREAVRPVTVALALARELRVRYPHRFRQEAIQNLLVDRSLMWAILRGEPLIRLRDLAEAERSRFLERRAPHLIYR
ncbi:MAG: exo-beta-N-acetylmuramidase NamZ domain-containing protein [Candidatus Methylomirabilia bacterium]